MCLLSIKKLIFIVLLFIVSISAYSIDFNFTIQDNITLFNSPQLDQESSIALGTGITGIFLAVIGGAGVVSCITCSFYALVFWVSGSTTDIAINLVYASQCGYAALGCLGGGLIFLITGLVMSIWGLVKYNKLHPPQGWLGGIPLYGNKDIFVSFDLGVI